MISDRTLHAVAAAQLAYELRREHILACRIESTYEVLLGGYRHTAVAHCLDGKDYYVNFPPLYIPFDHPEMDSVALSSDLVSRIAAAVNRGANEIARDLAVL